MYIPVLAGAQTEPSLVDATPVVDAPALALDTSSASSDCTATSAATEDSPLSSASLLQNSDGETLFQCGNEVDSHLSPIDLLAMFTKFLKQAELSMVYKAGTDIEKLKAKHVIEVESLRATNITLTRRLVLAREELVDMKVDFDMERDGLVSTVVELEADCTGYDFFS